MEQKEKDRKKALFIEGFAETGVIGTGCRRADIGRNTHKRWAEEDPEFLAACQDAYLTSVDLAEEELRARSVEGVDEIVMFKGEPVWKRNPKTGDFLLDDEGQRVPFTQHRKSDRLLEVYIKAHKPGYREPKGGGDTVYIDPIPKEIQDQSEGGDTGDGLVIEYILPAGKSKEHYDAIRNGDVASVEEDITDEEFEDMLS